MVHPTSAHSREGGNPVFLILGPRLRGDERRSSGRLLFSFRKVTRRGAARRPGNDVVSMAYEHPVVEPQVSHFMQVPLRTSVKFWHSPQASPS